jgi:hypothetical protein
MPQGKFARLNDLSLVTVIWTVSTVAARKVRQPKPTTQLTSAEHGWLIPATRCLRRCRLRRPRAPRRAKAVAILLDNAQADPAAAEMLQVAVHRYRDALATLARRLEDLGAVEPSDLNRTGDVFWFLFGWMSWRILITDLQWSWDEAEQWLTQRGIEALPKLQRRRP